MMRNSHHPYIAGASSGSYDINSTFSAAPGAISGITLGSPTTTPNIAATNPEQFGARSVRELVNMVPEIAANVARALRQSPVAIVEAIAKAKEHGLTDLAAQLQANLLLDGEPLPATAAPPKPAAVVEDYIDPCLCEGGDADGRRAHPACKAFHTHPAVAAMNGATPPAAPAASEVTS